MLEKLLVFDIRPLSQNDLFKLIKDNSTEIEREVLYFQLIRDFSYSEIKKEFPDSEISSVLTSDGSSSKDMVYSRLYSVFFSLNKGMFSAEFGFAHDKKTELLFSRLSKFYDSLQKIPRAKLCKNIPNTKLIYWMLVIIL